MAIDSGVSLDDPRTYHRLDPNDMYRLIQELPDQVADGWQRASALQLPDDYRNVSSVVIAGMGGSAIGGSLLESYGANNIPVPISIRRNYGLPAFVGQNTLLIAVSYSGNTEETVSALEEGHRRGAKLMAVSTGGKIKQLAEQWHIPLLTFHYDAPPRATLGYLFTPLVRVFDRLGFLPPQQTAIDEALRVLREVSEAWGGKAPSSENVAKQLAQASHARAVVIYGADYLSAVARRWKTQMNENAKNWAFYGEFPELDHNAVVGYEHPKALGAAMQIVMLYSPDLPARIRLRMEATQKLLDEFHVPWRLAEARGRGALAQMYSLIALGDYTSYYLALLNGADPTTIAPIDFLKDILSRSETAQRVPPAIP